MEKDRDSKLITIIALVVSIASLSIGFAALAKDVKIGFSNSNTKISGIFNMKIYGYDKDIDGYDLHSFIVKPALTSSIDNIESSPLIISDDYSTKSGGSVTFGDSNQRVKYTLALHNSEYLKSIIFMDYDETNLFKVCTALPGTNQSLVDETCKNIKITISTHDGSIVFDETNVNDLDLSSIQNFNNEWAELDIKISYDANAVVPNGDFKINFGSIKFNFGSVAANNE